MNAEPPVVPSSPRGRPREFDLDVAVAAALRTFFARGYAGASIAELTGAMKISRPSLYQCFGSKEGLFKRALELHAREHLSYLDGLLQSETIVGAVEELLVGAMESERLPCEAHGFMGLLAALSASKDDENARQEVVAHQAHIIDALANRFERAREKGELPVEANTTTLAYFLEALIHGIGIQARNAIPGQNAAELLRVGLKVFDLQKGHRDRTTAAETTSRALADPALA